MMLRKITRNLDTSGFRHDINAMRAIAFLAVVFFHFQIPGFQGGFAGVDIFFVISGYLIASLLFKNSDERSPNFLDFVSRRISRLIGPIIPVVTTSLILALVFLDSIKLVELARHSVSALLFVSNIVFWREIDYFNPESASRLLLHTWSLSLEVQFYLIFPLLLLVLRLFSKSRRVLVGFLCILTLASLGASIYISDIKAIPAFYLLPTRLWEFLIGALIFELRAWRPSHPKITTLLQGLGIALVAISLLWISKDLAWPGYYALLPCVGTALVLFASSGEEAFFKVWPFRILGVISYSGYLWHWPLVVMLVIFDQMNSYVLVGIGLLLTFVLGFLSWALVEQNASRILYRMTTAKRVVALGLGVSVFGAIPILIIQMDGMPQRFDPKTVALIKTGYTKPSYTRCSPHVTRNCVLSGRNLPMSQSTSPINAILIGDSHAGMLADALAQALPATESRVALFNQGACPTINEINIVPTGTKACRDILVQALTLSEKHPDVPLFIANRWSFYVHGFNETRRGTSPNYYLSNRFTDWSGAYRDEIFSNYKTTLCNMANTSSEASSDLTTSRRRVFVFAPFPEFTFRVSDRISMSMTLWDSYEMPVVTDEAYRKRNEGTLAMLFDAAKHCDIRVIDPRRGLCSTQAGTCEGADDNGIRYTDSNHLSRHGTKYLIKIIREQID